MQNIIWYVKVNLMQTKKLKKLKRFFDSKFFLKKEKKQVILIQNLASKLGFKTTWYTIPTDNIKYFIYVGEKLVLFYHFKAKMFQMFFFSTTFL